MTEAVKQICGYVFDKSDIIRIYAEPFAYRIQDRILLSKFYYKFIKRAENADEAFFGSFFMVFFAFERVFAEVIDMEVNSLYNSY